MCLKLQLDYYNFLNQTDLFSYFDIPLVAREALSFIPTLPMLKAVVYFKLKTNPKLSVRDTTRKYDVSHEQSFKAHKSLREMKAYKVELISE